MGWVLLVLALVGGVGLAGVLVFKGALIGMPENRRLEIFGPLPFLEPGRDPIDATTLQRRMVKAAAKGAVFVAVTGERRAVPNVVVQVSPTDYTTLTDLPQPITQTARDITELVVRRLEKQNTVFSCAVSVDIVTSVDVRDGRPRVRAAQQGHRGSRGEASAVTRVIGDDPAPDRTHTMAAPSSGTVPGAARLVGMSADQPEFTLGQGGQTSHVIGRAGDLVVGHDEVSARHASLTFEAGTWTLVDLDSTNGTFVNDQRSTTVRLRDGDRIGLGPAGPEYRFVWASA